MNPDTEVTEPIDRYNARFGMDRYKFSAQIHDLIASVGDIQYEGGYNKAMCGSMMRGVNGTREESEESYRFLTRALNWELALLELSFMQEVPQEDCEWLREQLRTILHHEKEHAQRSAAHAIDRWARKRRREERAQRLAELTRALSTPPPPPRPFISKILPPSCAFIPEVLKKLRT